MQTVTDREKLLVEQFKSLKDLVDKRQKDLDEAVDKLNQTQKELAELLQDQGKKKTATFEGLGHATLMSPQLWASVEIEREEALLEFLRENNRSDLIRQHYINSSQLSTFIREYLRENNRLPPGVKFYLDSELKGEKVRFYPFKKKK